MKAKWKIALIAAVFIAANAILYMAFQTASDRQTPADETSCRPDPEAVKMSEEGAVKYEWDRYAAFGETEAAPRDLLAGVHDRDDLIRMSANGVESGYLTLWSERRLSEICSPSGVNEIDLFDLAESELAGADGFKYVSQDRRSADEVDGALWLVR